MVANTKVTIVDETPGLPALLRKQDGLLKEGQLSKAICIAVKTIQKWRASGEGPPYLKLGATAVRYDPIAVADWLDDSQRRNTADDGGRS